MAVGVLGAAICALQSEPKFLTKITYINNRAGLNRLCQHVAQQTMIAIDTEFIREKTYYPQPCLLQLATRQQVFLLDLIAVDDCSRLCQLLAQTTISKVFHSCEQDLEVLQQLCADEINMVLDTQLAAAFLSHGYQISYENLVAQRLNIWIGNNQTRSNWAQRPLSQKQKDYAVADVVHLLPLWDSLSQELQQNDKYYWFLEESMQQAQHRYRQGAEHDAAPATFLNRARQWREMKAQQINRPRQWLVRDACLQGINHWQLDSKEAILQLPKCKHLRGKYAQVLAQMMSAQKANHSVSAALRKKPPRLLSREIDCLNKINHIIEGAARRHCIDVKLITTRRKIVRGIQQRSRASWCQTWRQEVLTAAEQQQIDGWLAALDRPSNDRADTTKP